MADVNILLLSKEDWNQKYNIPSNIHLNHYFKLDDSVNQLQDLIILDRDINQKEKEILQSITRAHCLYITENASMTEHTLYIEKSKVGKRLYTGDAEEFLNETAKDYFAQPYGEKFSPNFLQINQGFGGSVEFDGNYCATLKGSFGDKFSQIAYWKSNAPIFANQSIDLYLEYHKTGNVEITLKIIHFYYGSVSDIQQTWEFSEEELSKGVITIENKKDRGTLFASISAKGEGSLQIISLHDRISRRNQGFFLPGGRRFATKNGEEIFTYFDPGDMKPPIAFYFSGFRTQEGFEGYFMMRSLKCPMVLITDPRLEGGAFYLGDEEYEKMMVSIIKFYMKKFGASSDQIIFSGSSMGTYGSLYYGCDIKPHALILAKPLANAGNIAKNETLLRVGTFPTSLELLRKENGSLDEDAIEKLNKRFWDKFDKADWSKTKFIMSYLYEDDYDTTAYSDILSHLTSVGVQVYGKGIHGRHTDNTSQIIAWFRSQYNKILKEDFGRKNM